MKKIAMFLTIFLFLFIFSSLERVMASPESEEAGLTPDSPFYFLDTWQEKISLAFTFNPQAKAEKMLKYAEEKIAETEKLSEEQKAKYMDKALNLYNQYSTNISTQIDKLKAQGKDVDQLLQKVSESTLKHQEVLTKVLEKVPEEAKSGIQNALSKSQQGFKKATEAIKNPEAKQQIEIKVKSVQEKTAQKITPEQKQKLQENINKLKGILAGGVSPEEMEALRTQTVALINQIELIVQQGLSEEQKQQVLEAVNQVEAAISASGMSEEQKQAALNKIGEIEAMIQSGITPAQKMILLQALNELEKIVSEGLTPEQKEKIQEKIEKPTLPTPSLTPEKKRK